MGGKCFSTLYFMYWKGVKVLSLRLTVLSVVLCQSLMLLHLLCWFLERNAHASLRPLCQVFPQLCGCLGIFVPQFEKMSVWAQGMKIPPDRMREKETSNWKQIHRDMRVRPGALCVTEPNGSVKETAQKFAWHRGCRKAFKPDRYCHEL